LAIKAREIADEVTAAFTADGHTVTGASDCRGVLDLARRRTPDLVVADHAMARADGYEGCRTLRTTSAAPLVILSASTDEADELMAFASGADYYLRMPCAPRILQARLTAALRRGELLKPPTPPTRFTVGAIDLDTNTRVAHVEDKPLRLTRTEFDLLATLLDAGQRVVPRSELLRRVWGPWPGDDHVLEVHLSRLRSKIVAAGGPRIAEAIPGVGYRLGLHVAHVS
jgi:DNA-binding response OmpR family regulator